MECSFCKHLFPDRDRFCPNCGKVIGTPAAKQQLVQSFLRRCPMCNTVTAATNLFCINCGKVFGLSLISQEKAVTSPLVQWDPEDKKEQAAIEVISIPSGVTIAIKRSRTVEHTIDINWNISGELNFEAGIKSLINSSIRGEIERSQGRSYQQSETVEYEVHLNGEKCSRYKLVWTDIWDKGTVEMYLWGKMAVLPFQFRKRTELEVVPYEQ